MKAAASTPKTTRVIKTRLESGTKVEYCNSRIKAAYARAKRYVCFNWVPAPMLSLKASANPKLFVLGLAHGQ